jgi:hypothetical protein
MSDPALLADRRAASVKRVDRTVARCFTDGASP